MNERGYDDEFMIQPEDEDWEDRENIDDEEINLEEESYQSFKKEKSNKEELIEAIPYLIAIMAFCGAVFYFCSL